MWQLLATSPAGCAVAVVLGLLWGSFANVCVYRWPAGKSVVAPGSHCQACGTPIRWYDNVPLASWLWLRGRCRSCKATFSARYLVVEALTGALFGVAWWFTLGTGGMLEGSVELRALRFAIEAGFVFVMVVITFIDLDHKLILDKVTIPSMIVFYGASLVLRDQRWWEGLVGAVVGYGIVWTIAEIYYRLRKVEGLGLGDGKLLAVVGALLGWRGVVFALFGGSVIGSVIGISGLLVARRRGADAPADEDPAGEAEADEDAAPEPPPSLMKTELPFGPFLAAAAVLYLFAQPWLVMQLRLPAG